MNGVVDSTGAGDSFVATMIRCRLMGMTLADALEEASIYAVSTCNEIGALGAFPLKERKDTSDS
jgi:sugar/nucleoside kinase (ribokinase family)